MGKQKPTTKICKHCKTVIPYEARVCPQCRKKVKGGTLKWIIIAAIVIIIIAAGAGGSDDTKKVGEVSQSTVADEQTKDNNSESSVQTEQAASEAQTVYHVGDILQDGDLKIVYMSSGEYTSDNEFLQPAEGNKYIYIQLAFENTSDSNDVSVSMYSFECYADGYNVEMYYGGEDTLSATLSAGRSTSGYLYFEIPESATDIEVEYETNFFTEDKINFIYEGNQDSGYVLEANSTPTEGALHVGEKAESDSLNISYISCFKDDSDNMFIQSKEGYHYVTCEFEFENVSTSDQSVTFYSFDCYADGVNCEAAYFRDDAISATMSAGRKAKGTVTFEVPDDAEVVEVEYLSNFWTSNRVTFVVEE